MLVDNLSRSVAIKSQSQVLVAVKEARDLLFLLSRGERLADRYSARENFRFDLRLMEPDMDIVPCFNDSSFCVIDPACLLKGALAEARGTFLTVLDRYTLADVAKPRRRLSA
jgi:hypothetical protein